MRLLETIFCFRQNSVLKELKTRKAAYCYPCNIKHQNCSHLLLKAGRWNKCSRFEKLLITMGRREILFLHSPAACQCCRREVAASVNPPWGSACRSWAAPNREVWHSALWLQLCVLQHLLTWSPAGSDLQGTPKSSLRTRWCHFCSHWVLFSSVRELMSLSNCCELSSVAWLFQAAMMGQWISTRAQFSSLQRAQGNWSRGLQHQEAEIGRGCAADLCYSNRLLIQKGG